jgi:hypothetical protein
VLPVVLFGALLADVDRPLSGAEAAALQRLWTRPAGKALGPAAQARYLLRGRVRAGRVRKGMSDGQAGAILGAALISVRGRDWFDAFDYYHPLRVKVMYDRQVVRVNGRQEVRWSVRYVGRPSMRDIIDPFLPARRPRQPPSSPAGR